MTREEIAIVFGADSTQVDVALRSIRAKVRETSDSIKKDFLGALNPLDAVKGFGAAFAASLSVGAAAGFIHKIVELTGELIKNSEELGISTTSLQEWEFAAEQSNVKAEALVNGLGKLNKTIGEARSGSAEAAAKFEKWGIALYNAAGDAMPLDDVTGSIADKMAAMTDPTLRAAMAVDLMGKGGSAMIPVLKDGAAALEELKRQANVITPEQLSNIDKLDDTWRQFYRTILADGGKVIGTLTQIAVLLGRVYGLNADDSRMKTLAIRLAANNLTGNIPGFLGAVSDVLGIGKKPEVIPEAPNTTLDDRLMAAGEKARKKGQTKAETLSELNGERGDLQAQIEGGAFGKAGSDAEKEAKLKILALDEQIAEMEKEAKQTIEQATDALAKQSDIDERIAFLKEDIAKLSVAPENENLIEKGERLKKLAEESGELKQKELQVQRELIQSRKEEQRAIEANQKAEEKLKDAMEKRYKFTLEELSAPGVDFDPAAGVRGHRRKKLARRNFRNFLNDVSPDDALASNLANQALDADDAAKNLTATRHFGEAKEQRAIADSIRDELRDMGYLEKDPMKDMLIEATKTRMALDDIYKLATGDGINTNNPNSE